MSVNVESVVKFLLSEDGAIAAAVVDHASGMLLGGDGRSSIDLEIAAAGNTEVMRAKMKTMEMLNLDDEIDDVLITLSHQYHLMRPVKKHKGLFIYFVLDKGKSNLALARRALLDAEKLM